MLTNNPLRYKKDILIQFALAESLQFALAVCLGVFDEGI